MCTRSCANLCALFLPYPHNFFNTEYAFFTYVTSWSINVVILTQFIPVVLFSNENYEKKIIQNTTIILLFSTTFFRLIYTGCPRRNGQNFGRVFLMLKYTDINQNTYVQSWTVTEIKAREKCGLFAIPRTVPGSRDVIPIRCALSVLVYSWLKHVPRCDCTCKVLGNPKDNYDMSASIFVVQFNGFMSLTS